MAEAEWREETRNAGYSESTSYENEFEEAVVVRAPENRGSLAARFVIVFLGVSTAILPLFVGGKSPLALLALQFSLFALTLIALPVLLRVEDNSDKLRSARRFLPILSAILVIPMLQLFPLPVRLLGWINPQAAILYETTGVSFAPLSLNFANSLAGVLWVVTLVLTAYLILFLPTRVQRIAPLPSGHRTRRQSSRWEKGQESDRPIEFLQNSIICAAVLSGVISVAHLALGIVGYFGVFAIDSVEIGQLRSHWPFVNPNHLCVLLEIGCLLVLTKYFRLTQLRALRDPVRGNTSIGFRLIRSPERLGAEMWHLALGFVLFVVAVTTFSRAGISLLILSLVVLWITSDRLRRTSSNRTQLVSVSGKKGPTNPLASSYLSFLKFPLAAGLMLIFTLSLIGEGGRDLLSRRIDYGLSPDHSELRWQLWLTTLKMITDFPLWGVGFSAWSDLASRYVSSDLAAFTLDYAHNDPLQLVAEVGIAGSLAFVLCFAWVLTITLKTLRAVRNPVQRIHLIGTGLALVTMLIHSLVDFPFHIPSLSLIFVVLLAVHIRVIGRMRDEYDSHVRDQTSD